MSELLKKEVAVRLRSTIQHPKSKKESFDIHTSGVLTLKGEQPYLVYEEVQNEKLVRTTVKLNAESALILRSGGVKMRLPFQRGEQQTGSYDTGYGTFMITTNTKKLQFTDGQFLVHYELIVDEEVVGTYKLELTYTEAE
ncbi:DUF1934 domain-containing protein [Psychrobacillus sp. FSL W7-1457]|uniref:DUF1934 domain-containing protein n=1 Tax=unclassified Psychrobacillus TaxID=2636677 RepID=UPI0030F81CF9